MSDRDFPKPGNRRPDHPVEPWIVNRWSPRAMSGEPLAREELDTLLEAARWAPSSYNEQEWRFLYACCGRPEWEMFFDLLVEGNRAWCRNASALFLIAGKRTFTKTGEPNPVHLFDCGNAFENLALQGASMGLVVHGMQGFDYEKARKTLGIPADFSVVAMFAVGRPGDPEELPEALRESEVPTQRKPVSEIACEGRFSF